MTTTSTSTQEYPVLNGMFTIMFGGGILFFIAILAYVITSPANQIDYDVVINFGLFLGIMLVFPKATMMYANWKETQVVQE